MQGYLLLIDEDNLVNTHDTLDEKETTIFNEDYDDDDYLVDDGYIMQRLCQRIKCRMNWDRLRLFSRGLIITIIFIRNKCDKE